MCGRYSFTSPASFAQRFKVTLPIEPLTPRYNAAPGQVLPVITNETKDKIKLYLWGLIPYWVEDSTSGFINARSENLLEKPSFKTAVRSKRCLVLADSFYEWKKTETGKEPYRVMLKSAEPFAFAGIWDRWQGAPGEAINSFAIVTTKPNSLLAKIHRRMPVILLPEDEKKWLDERVNISAALDLLKPYPAEKMKAYRISKLINSPANDSPEVTRPV